MSEVKKTRTTLAKKQEFEKSSDLITFESFRRQVKAKPISRGEYNKLRGWRVPVNENPDDEGFLVVNPNVTERNLIGYDGYVSWLPKKAFNETYYRTETHKDRMIQEEKELSEKLSKLEEFFQGDIFKDLPDEIKNLMNHQREAMSDYRDALARRIELT